MVPAGIRLSQRIRKVWTRKSLRQSLSSVDRTNEVNIKRLTEDDSVERSWECSSFDNQGIQTLAYSYRSDRIEQKLQSNSFPVEFGNAWRGSSEFKQLYKVTTHKYISSGPTLKNQPSNEERCIRESLSNVSRSSDCALSCKRGS